MDDTAIKEFDTGPNCLAAQECRGDFWLMLERAIDQAGGDIPVEVLNTWSFKQVVELLAQNGIRMVHSPAWTMRDHEGIDLDTIPQKGDYVLASVEEEGRPDQPWGIGFLEHTPIYAPVRLLDATGQLVEPGTEFKRVVKISGECGVWMYQNREEICAGQHSVWYYAEAPKKTTY